MASRSSAQNPGDAADLAHLRAMGIDTDALDFGPGGAELLPRQDDREAIIARAILDGGARRHQMEGRSLAVHPWVVLTLQQAPLQALVHLTHAERSGAWDALDAEVYHTQLAPARSGEHTAALTIARLPAGASLAAAQLEELIAGGGQHFIVLELAGSLHEQIPVGTLLVPTISLREEGTSFHYVPAGTDVQPDATLVELATAACRDLGITPMSGSIWTTDAPYRLLASKVAAYRAMGIVAVEMAAAALFAVAMLRGVRLAVVAALADPVADLWHPSYMTATLAQARDQLAQVALRCVAHA